MSAADDVAAYLVAQLHATAVGTDIFINWMPDTPDEAICVYDSPGEPADHAFGSMAGGSAILTHPGVQIQKRHVDGDTAMDKAILIHDELDGLGKATLNSVAYEAIFARQLPFFLR